MALALGTGRRFWELVKTGTFVENTPYPVDFTGQVGHGREEEAFEIPTLLSGLSCSGKVFLALVRR